MPSSSAPSVETLEIGRQSVALHEVRLASPEHGEVHLCFADDVCVRLAEDDLLRLPSGGGCRARAAQGGARLRVLRVGRVWLAQALGLLDAPDGGACVDRAGSEEARRARRLFDAHVHPGAAEEGESLRDAARRLELLALALESQPFEPTSAGLRRRNHGREALVRMVAALRDASLEEVSLASLALELGLSERADRAGARLSDPTARFRVPPGIRHGDFQNDVSVKSELRTAQTAFWTARAVTVP